MVATESLPDPPPSVPATFFALGPPAARRPSKSLCTWPDMERRVTVALACAGSRIATSPETVPTRTSPAGARSTSAVTRPLTVLASSRPRRPSASVRSPDTDLKAMLPSSPWASRLPETVLASTAPVRPSSMMSPEMLLSEVRADTPDTTAVALTTPSCVGQSLWTVIVMFAECRCGRSHPRSPSQVRSS